MRRLWRRAGIAAVGFLLTAGGHFLVGVAASDADDDPVTPGSGCRGDQLGGTSTAIDSATVRCLATGEGGFTWVADTGAVGTIADLQKQGYTVTIDRVGDHPLSACKVIGVRNPVTKTQTTGNPLGAPHTPGGVITVTVNRSVWVSLDCSGS